MPLVINGVQEAPHPGRTVADLVADRTGRPLDGHGDPVDGGRLPVAVAVDGAVVPRSEWSATVLPDDGEVELVTAVQGG